MIENKVIAVWFSCGAASAIAAKLTVMKYGQSNKIIVVNNSIKEEYSDNLRFLKDIEKWIGIEIQFATNKNFPSNSAVDVWDKKKYMSGVKGAPCTVELKKEARHQFELTHKIDYHVLGFTVDEKNRHERFIKYERENTIPVLIDENISKKDCFDILISYGIELPLSYRVGYPNANCVGCVKATSPTYWNHVRKTDPKVFAQRAKQSRRIGARLVRYKGKRMFLDELPEDAIGNKMKGVECGIFCETKISKS